MNAWEYLTLEQDVPVLYVTAVDRDRDPARPVSMSASAANLNLEQALRRVLEELGPTLYGHLRKYDPAHAARLAADPGLVLDLNDHPILYGDPGAFERMSFLPFGGPAVEVDTLRTRLAWPEHSDLADDLAELAGRYLASGLDVITVDTTSPEARASGLVSAKVIVPGTAPMTFGHKYRRTHGLPRLLNAAAQARLPRPRPAPGRAQPAPAPFPVTPPTGPPAGRRTQ
jgi:ribosomal protein S12 methylthiotransferase accessory factor